MWNSPSVWLSGFGSKLPLIFHLYANDCAHISDDDVITSHHITPHHTTSLRIAHPPTTPSQKAVGKGWDTFDESIDRFRELEVLCSIELRELLEERLGTSTDPLSHRH